MAMLGRYKRSGGFLQLLRLLETCTDQKKETLLGTIEKEDKRWSDAIREKMLTINEIFKWDKVLLGEIFQNIQELTLAIALHKFTDEQKEIALHTHSHVKRRNIEDLSETKKSNAGEIHTAISKIIEETRSLASTGHIKLKKIAPHLYIDDDIESQIDNGVSLNPAKVASSNPFEQSSVDANTLNFDGGGTSTAPSKNDDSQVIFLKNEVAKLKKENLVLKKEVSEFKIKLTKVQKLVA